MTTAQEVKITRATPYMGGYGWQPLTVLIRTGKIRGEIRGGIAYTTKDALAEFARRNGAGRLCFAASGHVERNDWGI